MELAVGDVVVYAAHGVGTIAAREERIILGKPQHVVVLELAGSLSVTLSVERAKEQLRPVLGKSGVKQVQLTLGQDGVVSDDVWLKRLKEGQAKLASGKPVELAEVVRDLARRQRVLSAKGAKGALSASERTLYMKARQLLAAEIAVAVGIDAEEADDWIDKHLAEA